LREIVIFEANKKHTWNLGVTFQHQPIGLAKRIGSRLKNSYPRELVRDGKLFTGNA
ncbi:hypothetical protein HC536_23165, partial [Escherichia coli]|nr:hypothetical protein [Escherichia coli]